jgi:hypothetical protein
MPTKHIIATLLRGFVEPAHGASDPSHGTAVYVIVDAQLMRTRSILSLTATDAELEGAKFQFTAIPLAYPHLNSFDFGTPSMQSLFRYGYRCAQAGRLWTSSPGSGRGAIADNTAAGQPAQCPTDDEFIGRLAVR